MNVRRIRLPLLALLFVTGATLFCSSGTLAGKPGGSGGPKPTPNSYAIASFGPLPGGSYTKPSGMNNHGEVVGRADASDGLPHGFVYSPAAGLVDLNDQFLADGLKTPDGGDFTYDPATSTGWLVITAADINDSGQIGCVLAKRDTGITADQVPARYTPASSSPTGSAQLDFLVWDVSAYSWPRVYAINESGDVVGGGAGVATGFLWTDAQTGLNGQLTANVLPYASDDLNDKDGSGRIQIVGDNHRYTVNVNTLAVSNDADLGTLFPRSRRTYDWAAKINNSGDVVGNSQDSSKSPIVQHGYRYTNIGGLKDLGTLGGATTNAVSINGSGDVIGISNTSTGEFHVFLYSDAFPGITDLSAAVPGVVLTPPNGNGIGVVDINDLGDICGEYGSASAYILIRQE